MTLRERFMDKVSPEPMSGCWLWVNSGEYGRMKVSGVNIYAHRLSYELFVGPIPKGTGYHGTCVLHKCDIPACVNPDHLFLGSNADNVADMKAKNRTAGRNGKRNGQLNPNAKLTSLQVRIIKRLLINGTLIQREITGIFNISRTVISMIKTGENWAND